MKKAISAVLVVGVLFGCGDLGKKNSSATPGANGVPAQASVPCTPAAAAPTGPLARINGRDITADDVRQVAGPRLQQAESDLYDARKDAIDQIVDNQLIDEAAKKEGLTKADYLKKKVFDQIKIGDKEVEKFYNENKAQMQGKSLDDVKDNIRGYLYRDQHQKVYGTLVASLRKNADVAILIHAPKVDIEEGDNPSIGPKDAPVHIVEFTDYQCPFCGKSRPTVNKILSDYKGKVRYVLRDFPLSFHKDSVKAHEAARCAGEQGKYWQMNKQLFGHQRALKVDDIKNYAKDLRLNMDKFDKCLDSDKYAKVIKENQAYGEKVGVSGTPSFFINGRMISGARPFSAFQEIIEDELRNAKN